MLSIAGYLLAIGLVCWVAMCLFLWAGQDSLLFYPRTLDEGTRLRLADSELHVTAKDGTRLHGWTLASETSADSGAVIYYGGNAEEVSDELERYAKLTNRSVAGLNYRGYGLSEGKPGADALRSDALEGFDAMVESLRVDPGKVVVIGRSLGSNMAAHIAASRDIGGLILVTPYDSIEEVAKKRYWLFPVSLLLRHHLDTVPETASIAAPTLVVLAEHDYVVPHDSTKRLLESWQGSGEVTEQLVPDASHGNINGSPRYEQLVTEFVAKVVGTQ